ncbi:MAG: hypothetical protein Ct9H300mP14_04740 [Gammaproteobacteria bacterium]|nr:MAG: hypothetical protein Ct9H300mP14_04740 [Gammaproteobacteria bacterium]
MTGSVSWGGYLVAKSFHPKIKYRVTPKRLLVVGHTPSGEYASPFDAVVEGASSIEKENVEVMACRPFDVQPQDVQTARAVILGTTENLGYMSGALKDFFDRIYYPCPLTQTPGMPYALYVPGWS